LYNYSLANHQKLCSVGPVYKNNGLDATPLVDSRINKRLIKRHSLIE